MFDKDTGHAVIVDFGISKVPFLLELVIRFLLESWSPASRTRVSGCRKVA